MSRFVKIVHTIVLILIPGGGKAIANYIRRFKIFGCIGENVSIQSRRLPVYPKLVYIHNNVLIATDVRFTVHDGIHNMLNNIYGRGTIAEKMGCIEIGNNVFVGAGCRILYNTRIGNNVIVGAGSLVNKDIPDNSVYAGVPAKKICSFDEYVKKTVEWSNSFKALYGEMINGNVNDKFADLLYSEFVKEKEKAGNL